MMRLIPYLALSLTIFTVIAIILINVGGVNPGYSSRQYYTQEKTWNCTIEPRQYTLFDSYEYHLYLNRFCYFARSTENSFNWSIVSGTYRNARTTGKLEDGRDLITLNALVGDIASFRFRTVYLVVLFEFCILTALCCFFMLPLAPFGGKRLSHGVTWAFALVFVIVASTVLTRQMIHLRDQIRDDTRVTNLPSQILGGQIGDTTNWYTSV
ncbi:hypothetical protein BDZ45DRAFT_798504 [Acephala macrosclerotiorum]|nr:hypothetical protein BDZ45DRAFT_798504 [Acephala macrosclerotiorum]